MNTTTRVIGPCALFVTALILAGLAVASGIEGTGIRGHIKDEFYFVDADFEISLGEDARKAVDSGVPLTFNLDIEVMRVRRYLWNETEITLRRSYQLARHALAERYIVTDLVSEKRTVAPSMEAALQMLGRISGVTVAKVTDIVGQGPMVGRARLRLDIESLPAPLRPIAYISPKWRMKSSWQQWSITK
jgi:hypothetical protein